MDVDNAINISKELIVKIIEGVYSVHKKTNAIQYFY